MTKKHYKVRILALILVLSCIFSSLIPSSAQITSYADDQLDDLQQQYDDLNSKIASNEEELGDIQSEQNDVSATLSTINDEITEINSQISILDSKISILEGKVATLNSNIQDTTNQIQETENAISEADAKISAKEASMEDTKAALLGRIRENYVAGESSTIEVLFSSTDLSSYFERQELMNQVSAQDAELIKSLTADIDDLNTMRAGLEQNKADLEVKNQQLVEEQAELSTQEEDLYSSRADQTAKMKEVSAMQQEVQDHLSELDENSDEYKAIIKRQRAERTQLDSQIDAYIKEHGSAVGDTPDATYENDGSMAWPVKFKSYVSCGYGYYSDGSPHWGIDICAVGGGSSGRPFCAAQGGKVIIAKNDGNYNYGFGNYCVIDHGDGKQTLYAHSSDIQVSVGQVVKKGQQIGLIGATGNVTGPHLHFEVRIKNADGSVSRVNPLNYVKNTTA